MFVLINIDGALLTRVLAYLKRLGIWHRQFPEKAYDVVVTPQDRIEAIRRNHNRGQLNPNRAWETCASFIQAWDWDSLGRGPDPRDEDEIARNGDTAPAGMGYVSISEGRRRRVAGECANPTGLSYIWCTRWCPYYQPTSIEGLVYMAESTAAVHEERAATLRRQADWLRQVDAGYEQAITSGKVWRYENGKFVITEP